MPQNNSPRALTHSDLDPLMPTAWVLKQLEAHKALEGEPMSDGVRSWFQTNLQPNAQKAPPEVIGWLTKCLESPGWSAP